MAKLTKFILLILLIWFIWFFNIKPFQINSQINIASYLAEEGHCQAAVETMENILPKTSFLDSYSRLKYVEIINNCMAKENLEKTKPLLEKTIKALEEAVKTRPYYTRSWFLLGQYNNLLLENWQEDRGEQARTALEKALELSPRRQEVLQELARTYIITGEYEEAGEKAEQCINLNEKLASCWWLEGLANIYLNDIEKADYNMQIAAEKRYPVKSEDSYLQLAKAYIEIKNYPRLVGVYLKLIKLEPENPKNYASLAFVYRELNQIEEARKQALKIIELFPEHRTETEEFLRTLE